jgi:hypothetical protein
MYQGYCIQGTAEEETGIGGVTALSWIVMGTDNNLPCDAAGQYTKQQLSCSLNLSTKG